MAALGTTRARCVLGMAALWMLWGGIGCDDEVLRPLSIDTSQGGGGGSGGAISGPTITIALTVHDIVTTDKFLEGVTICVLDLGIECVTTDADGKATVEVPANTPVWATLELDHYASTLIGANTGSEDLDLEAPMVGSTLVSIVAGGVGADLDDTKSQLALIALGPKDAMGKYTRQGGVTMQLNPASGEGPYFLNDQNLIDPSLTATSPVGGGGLLFNIDPVDAELTAKTPTAPCHDFLAHPKGNDRYEVRTLPGFVTVITLECGDRGGTGGTGGTGGAGGTGGTGGAGGSGGQ